MNNISYIYQPKSGVSENSLMDTEVMDLCWTGENPLPKPIMTQFTDAYVHDQASMR